MKREVKYDFSDFITVSKKQRTFLEMIDDIFDFVSHDSDSDYRIIIGTDSEGYGDVIYATAVVVHRVGHGARAFICKNKVYTPYRVLRDKIYNESMLSLSLAQELVPFLAKLLGEDFMQSNFVIHSDIGNNGDTKDMIKEIVGMVRGYGFQVEIKPDSYAASSVADRFAVPLRKTVPQAV